MNDLSKYQPKPEQLEVGKRYEFSDGGDEWFVGIYIGVTLGHVYQYSATGENYKYIREDQSEAGKILPMPVSPKDGEWWLCQTNVRGCDHTVTAYFDGNRFYASDLMVSYFSDVTPIKRMVVDTSGD